MNREELCETIDAACQTAMAMGWEIAPGRTINRAEKCCCPLGAVALVNLVNDTNQINAKIFAAIGLDP